MMIRRLLRLIERHQTPVPEEQKEEVKNTLESAREEIKVSKKSRRDMLQMEYDVVRRKHQ